MITCTWQTPLFPFRTPVHPHAFEDLTSFFLVFPLPIPAYPSLSILAFPFFRPLLQVPSPPLLFFILPPPPHSQCIYTCILDDAPPHLLRFQSLPFLPHLVTRLSGNVPLFFPLPEDINRFSPPPAFPFFHQNAPHANVPMSFLESCTSLCSQPVPNYHGAAFLVAKPFPP